jgi:hypothetical protein
MPSTGPTGPGPDLAGSRQIRVWRPVEPPSRRDVKVSIWTVGLDPTSETRTLRHIPYHHPACHVLSHQSGIACMKPAKVGFLWASVVGYLAGINTNRPVRVLPLPRGEHSGHCRGQGLSGHPDDHRGKAPSGNRRGFPHHDSRPWALRQHPLQPQSLGAMRRQHPPRLIGQ